MDVVDLREFYASLLGKATRRIIANKLSSGLGADVEARIMGLGYAAPYIGAQVNSFAFMMARRGVTHWPEEGLVRSVLVDELDLPLTENAVEVALLVHGLEFTDSPEELLEEIWRVLTPQGRLLVVVPNRRSLWALSDASPFGHGQPFSRGQLLGLLRAAQFSVTRVDHALFVPPLERVAGWRVARIFERNSANLFNRFSGVFVVEATKQVYAYAAGRKFKRLGSRVRPLLLPTPHFHQHPTQR